MVSGSIPPSLKRCHEGRRLFQHSVASSQAQRSTSGIAGFEDPVSAISGSEATFVNVFDLGYLAPVGMQPELMDAEESFGTT